MDIPWIFLLLMMCQVTASKRVHKWRTHVKSHCDQEHLPSFMWKIKRQSSPPSYLFGTIHVPYTLVWDSIPLTIKKAFEESDCIYFELDLLSKYTISALSNCQILPHGKRLTDVLPADLYRRLKRHLDYVRSILPKWMTPDQRGRGLYSEYLFNAITGNWERKRPVWVMLMINSLTESDIKSRGVPVLDLYLAQEAQRMNKWTGAVERVEEQCLPMNDLSATHVIFALNTTLVQQENIRRGLSQPSYTTQDLIHHYNCGSLSGIIFNQVPSLLQSSSSEEAVKEQESARLLEEYFRAELVIKRNLKMSRKIMDILQSDSKKSYFFAFGAGHFIGRDSIIEVLRASGYEVERVTDVHNQEDRGSLPLHKSQRRNACGFRPCSNGSFVQWKHRHARQKNLNAHRNDKIGEEEILGHSSQSKSGQIDENSLINKRHSKLYLEDGGTYGKGTNDLPSVGLLSSTSHSRRHSFPKKFNDLWVRLETANDKVPLLIRPREDILNEVHTGNSYFHALSTTASASSSLSLCVHHSIFNKLLFIFMSQQLSYMTKSSLIRHKSEL